MSCLRYEVDALLDGRGPVKMTKKQKRRHDHDVVKAFTRELLSVAESDIKLADFIVRNNRGDGAPDDPESTRKLRLSFRRVQYRLATMASIDPTLGADDLIQRLGDVSKLFGRLRDAEVLEASVIRALGSRVTSSQGRQLMDIAARSRRNLQHKTDDLLKSDKYHDTLREVSEFRTSLPTRFTSSETLTPMARRALRTAWGDLRREIKQARRKPSDRNLHSTRVAAKRMLYAAQALSDVVGSPVEEFARRLDVMQKYLGKQHDLVIASNWFRDISTEQPQLKKVAKKLAAQERQRADKRAERWHQHWRAVKELHADRRW
ncbi:MAG TPA: CHAD domain-containing protein [Acidimicrobiales bacterium]|nr:CHAD domain-containing protein [Acidimicrobiales bacterium]